MRAPCGAATVVLALASTAASAQSVRLSLPEALSRARNQSPAVLSALARVEESRARVVGARIRFRENPTLEVSAGPRFIDGSTRPDFEVGLGQLFETGGQRVARIAGADAAVAGALADVESTRREVIAATASTFYRVTHAEAVRNLRVTSEQTAEEVLRIAERRYEAGDIPVLDVNLARAALARARSARIAAEAEHRLEGAELGRLIGLGPEETVTTDAGLEQTHPADLARLLAALGDRGDLRALAAGILEANADVRLGLASRRPDVALDARMKQEAGDRAIVGGLTVSLPAFNNGQELRAAGSARAERLRTELDAARALAASQVRSLFDAYVSRRAAADALEQDALPGALENQRLAQRSYEEGELSLADLLVVRRELTDTQLEYLDRLLDAATTAVARDSAAGVLQ